MSICKSLVSVLNSLLLQVSNMSNPADEYANKWQRMKTQRDARIDREFKRKVRAEMVHTFKRVVISSEK